MKKTDPNNHVVLISGEASGDYYASDLIKHLKVSHPHLHFSGMAGTCAQEAGMELWYDYNQFSIMTFVDALLHMRTFTKLLSDIKARLLSKPPKLLILIDYAGFNLKLAQFAHEHKIPCFYYIPPKVWASRKKRIHKLRQYADSLAVLYPFEADFFEKEQLPCHLVHHPLLNHLPIAQTPSGTSINIAILPGSRRGEIVHILPVQLASCYQFIRENDQPMQFYIFLSDLKQSDLVHSISKPWSDKLSFIIIPPSEKKTYLTQCHVGLAMSGTITLELTLMGIPHIILGKVRLLDYLAFRFLYKHAWIGLPNLMAQTQVVPELLQYDCKPELINKHLYRLLFTDAGEKMRNDLYNLRQELVNDPRATSIQSITSKLIDSTT